MTDGILLDRLTVGHSADAPTVRNATAHLRPGTLGCVIGRNGAGKSTLLETLAGLRAPLSGVVTLDGAVPHELPPRRRAERVGYSPQNDTIPRGLTALDYVLLARRPERSFWPFDADDDVAAARRALEACCADPLADRTLGAMSGGELQRVRLALALVGGARFLLLDEPSSHLDPRHRIETFELLRGLDASGSPRSSSRTISTWPSVATSPG
jgi:iron complex transport system ATP-binding protein